MLLSITSCHHFIHLLSQKILLTSKNAVNTWSSEEEQTSAQKRLRSWALMNANYPPDTHSLIESSRPFYLRHIFMTVNPRMGRVSGVRREHPWSTLPAAWNEQIRQSKSAKSEIWEELTCNLSAPRSQEPCWITAPGLHPTRWMGES